MSWLDAHESFFIDLVADDRIADLHGSIDAETPSREGPPRHHGRFPRRHTAATRARDCRVGRW